MKLLAIHSANHPNQQKRSGVDTWRLSSKLKEMRKHVDWQIDEQLTIIPDIEGYSSAKEFTQAEMEKAFTNVCRYDMVLTSYQSNPTFYTMLKVAEKRAGVQYLMDADDNMFAINPDNPVWAAISDENVYNMQCMIRDNTWITTTTEALAEEFRTRRTGHHKDSVLVNPNYIHEAYKPTTPHNGDKVVVGFVGGSSHYGDLHRTGVLDALARVMHEHKQVYFKSVGMPIDRYLPRARVQIVDAQKGDAYFNEIFPNLGYDISIAPLEDNLFNRGKSNIKWQESTRAGAAFLGSNIGPYSLLPPGTATLCANDEDEWYHALTELVTDPDKRRAQVVAAQADLAQNWCMETRWPAYKQLLERVYTVGQQTKKKVVQHV